ncbi:MAG: hypothetical protein WCL22_04045 [bacterium]
MKKIIVVISFLIIKVGSFAQSSNVMTGSSCTCKDGQAICSAETWLMSCCTCCTPPASCGSWTSWGLCGCKCESAANNVVINSEVKLYLNKYADFMNFLLINNIDATKFQQYFKNAITNKPVIKAANVINDYVVLQGNDLSTFTTAYLADMVALTKDPKVASLLVAYLHIK